MMSSPGLRYPWAEAHRLLRCVLHGSAQPEVLHQWLAANVHRALTALPWCGRSEVEQARVRDPAFEHCGHTLEPLGRELVIQLSEELQLSELVCWEMLLDEVAASPESQLDMSELKERLACTYFRDRHSMLLVLFDCLKLCSYPSYEANAAWPVAAEFLSRLEREGQSGGSLSSSQGLGAQSGPYETIAERLLQSIDMLQRVGGQQPSAGQELILACQCLFFAASSAQRVGEPPRAPSEGCVLKMCEQLRKCAEKLGQCEPTDLLFLATVSAILQQSQQSCGRVLDTVYKAPWPGAPHPAIQPSLVQSLSLALDFACTVASSVPASSGSQQPSLTWFQSATEGALTFLRGLCARHTPYAAPRSNTRRSSSRALELTGARAHGRSAARVVHALRVIRSLTR